MRKMNSRTNWKRNASIYLFSQLISQFGTSVVQYAIFWYINLSAQSGVVLTLTTIVSFLPTFILSPFAGVWADRYNKKKMIIISDGSIAIATLILAIVFFAGYNSLVLLLVITFIRAIGVGIQNPASNSLIPQFIPKESLVSFNGVLASTLSLINIGAPAVSAVLLNFLSFYQILLIDVVTAFIGISIFIFLKVPEVVKEKASGYIEDIKSGIRYIAGKPYLIVLFIYIAIQFFLVSPEAFLPILQVIRNYGDEIFRLSIIEIAFFVGMFLGGLVIAKVKGFKNRIYTLITTIFVLATLSIIMSFKISFTFYVLVLFITGLMVVSFNTATTVFLQENTETNYQGRVFGIFNMINSATFPLGLLFFGPLADIVSIESILRVTGILLLILAIFMINTKSIIKAGSNFNKKSL